MTVRSGEVVPTTVVAVAVLFPGTGSFTLEPTDAVAEMTVPLAVPLLTLTVSTKLAAVPPVMVRVVHTTVPVRPTPGEEHDQPAGGVREANVVLAGMGKDSVALSAALGPRSLTEIV